MAFGGDFLAMIGFMGRGLKAEGHSGAFTPAVAVWEVEYQFCVKRGGRGGGPLSGVEEFRVELSGNHSDEMAYGVLGA
jgi:hypothetical protein